MRSLIEVGVPCSPIEVFKIDWSSGVADPQNELFPEVARSGWCETSPYYVSGCDVRAPRLPPWIAPHATAGWVCCGEGVNRSAVASRHLLGPFDWPPSELESGAGMRRRLFRKRHV